MPKVIIKRSLNKRIEDLKNKIIANPSIMDENTIIFNKKNGEEAILFRNNENGIAVIRNNTTANSNAALSITKQINDLYSKINSLEKEIEILKTN